MLIHGRPANKVLCAPSRVIGPSGVVNCVFLTCFEHDAFFFKSMLNQTGICLHHTDSVAMADFLLLATSGTVLLMDTNFLDESWEGPMAMRASVHPMVTAMICADQVDRPFLQEAPDYGVFQILWRPLDVQGVSSAIRKAHEAAVERRLWRAEAEVSGCASEAERAYSRPVR